MLLLQVDTTSRLLYTKYVLFDSLRKLFTLLYNTPISSHGKPLNSTTILELTIMMVFPLVAGSVQGILSDWGTKLLCNIVQYSFLWFPLGKWNIKMLTFYDTRNTPALFSALTITTGVCFSICLWVNDDGIHNVCWDTLTPRGEPLSHRKSRKWLHVRGKTPLCIMEWKRASRDNNNNTNILI